MNYATSVMNKTVSYLTSIALALDEYRMPDEIYDCHISSWYAPGRIRNAHRAGTPAKSRTFDGDETEAEDLAPPEQPHTHMQGDISDSYNSTPFPSDETNNDIPTPVASSSSTHGYDSSSDSDTDTDDECNPDDVTDQELAEFRHLGTLVNTMPMSKLHCGQERVEAKTLHDSGACANITTAAFAKKCGARLVRRG